MTAVNGVMSNNAAGASSGASQDQSALNQGIGLVGQTTFQMLLNQLMQNTSQFQDAMQDPSMDTSDDS